MKLLPSRRVLCTPYNHAPCHFMQSHIRKVYACLAVTCHLYFWRNDRGFSRATAVTRGWNGYRNKSHHRKLTLEKKILPPLLQGFELATFRSRVRRSNHWAIPAPAIPNNKGKKYANQVKQTCNIACVIVKRTDITYISPPPPPPQHACTPPPPLHHSQNSTHIPTNTVMHTPTLK